MKNSKIFTILINVTIFTFFALPVLAAVEMVYPSISLPFGKTLTLNNDSTTAEFAVYFYSLFVGMATVAAFVVIVWAGLEMVISSGNTEKFRRAKAKILGALVGLIVMFSSYIVLNAISPELLKPKDTAISCDKLPISVCVERLNKSEEGKDKISVEMSFETRADLGLKDTETLTIKKFDGLKEVWGYSGLNWTGTAKLLYKDINSATKEEMNNPLLQPIAIDSTVQSVKVFLKGPGFYFYESLNSAPKYIDRSYSDLSNGEEPSVSGSIEIINNQKENIRYYGVAFGKSGYNDYGVANAISSPSKCLIVDKDKTVSVINSLLLFQGSYSQSEQTAGEIIFYNTIKCGLGASQVKTCAVPIAKSFSSEIKPIGMACSDWGGEKVLSMRITGPAGVALFTNSNVCKYWDKDIVDESGNCIGYDNFLINQSPQSFLIIPYDKKIN